MVSSQVELYEQIMAREFRCGMCNERSSANRCKSLKILKSSTFREDLSHLLLEMTHL